MQPNMSDIPLGSQQGHGPSSQGVMLWLEDEDPS